MCVKPPPPPPIWSCASYATRVTITSVIVIAIPPGARMCALQMMKRRLMKFTQNGRSGEKECTSSLTCSLSTTDSTRETVLVATSELMSDMSDLYERYFEDIQKEQQKSQTETDDLLRQVLNLSPLEAILTNAVDKLLATPPPLTTTINGVLVECENESLQDCVYEGEVSSGDNNHYKQGQGVFSFPPRTSISSGTAAGR
eukprot:gene5622-7180_t